MSERKIVSLICDQCGKRADHDGEIRYGGHPYDGWLEIHIHGGRTDLASLQRQRRYDVCSWKCAATLAKKRKGQQP